MEESKIKQILEAALLASDGPLTVANLVKIFAPGELNEDTASRDVRAALKSIEEECETRGVELKRVASGYRFQVRQELSEWVSRLWDEKPPRYTRALLETLALVAYKQPVTRGDIEQVRGVSVSQNIMRTLLEREWVKIVGYKEVPGKPALYATTKEFLDYFNLSSLNELPPLPEIRALIEPVLEEEIVGIPEAVREGDGEGPGSQDVISEEAVPEEQSAAASDEDQGEQADKEADKEADEEEDAGASGITVEPVSMGADVVPLHRDQVPK